MSYWADEDAIILCFDAAMHSFDLSPCKYLHKKGNKTL